MSQKKIFFLLLLLIPLISLAAADIKVYEFYSATCPHCTNVRNSGILEQVGEHDDVSTERHEISTPGGFTTYEAMHERRNMQQGVPLAVIECETGELQHLIGDTPIINELERAVENCRTGSVPSGSGSNMLYYIIGIVVIAGIGYYLYAKNKKKK